MKGVLFVSALFLGSTLAMAAPAAASGECSALHDVEPNAEAACQRVMDGVQEVLDRCVDSNETISPKCVTNLGLPVFAFPYEGVHIKVWPPVHDTQVGKYEAIWPIHTNLADYYLYVCATDGTGALPGPCGPLQPIV